MGTPRRVRDDDRVRLHRTRRRRRVRTFKRTTTTDVYSHASARRVRRRVRLCDRGDDDRQHPPSDVERRTPGRRTPGRRTWATHTWASSVFTGNLGSCAFVANNPTLPMGGGPKIDAHETVVRFNNFWERRIPDKRKGTKVDLLVMSENKGPDAAIHSKAQFKEFKKNYGGKCYISDRSLYQHRRGSPIYWWNSKEIREIGCEIIPQRVYDACMRGLKDQYNATQNFPHVIPTTGMLGVMHIGHRCASIALYGFTLPEPPYPTFPRVPHLFAEEHAVLKSVFPKAVFH